MATQLELAGVSVDEVTKDIKNLHLSVYPPTGRVRIAAPLHMKLETIRVFAISKLGWIKRQQRQVADQEREAPREYLERESHYVWGKRYLMKVAKKATGLSNKLKDAPNGKPLYAAFVFLWLQLARCPPQTQRA